MNKKYFSISEVAKILEVSTSNLRFWESEFQQLKPQVSSGGTRRYVQKDIDLLRTIKYLLKEQCLTIEGARQRMKISLEKDIFTAQAIEKLNSIRSELVAIRHEINCTSAMAEDTIVD